jgi:gluconokinase
MSESATPHFLGRAVVVMGVSGSGKTTIADLLAKRLGWTFVEGDRLHPPANVERMRQGIPLTDADREPWLDRIGEELRAWGRHGSSGILTCSALKRAYRDRIRASRSEVRFVYLRGSEAMIVARVGARHHEYMPGSLLQSQFETLEEPTPDEGVVTIEAGESLDAEVENIVTALDLAGGERA